MEEVNNALPGIISEILESPKLAEIMQSIRLPEKSEDAKEDDAPVIPSIPPEVLAKLPDVISALTGGEGDTKNITDKLPGVMNTLSAATEPKKTKKPSLLSNDARRKALLRALRPYMSDRRQNIIDTVIRLESMAEIMSTLMEVEKL